MRAAQILVLLSLVLATPAFAAERAVDQKLFCGEGMSGYQDAVTYIKSRARDKASIDKLTPEFACSLASLLKAGPPGLGVNVGWYPVTASVKTMGVSYCQHYECKEGTMSHPRGLAADLTFGVPQNKGKGTGGTGAANFCAHNALCAWVHQNAGNFGLMFRLMPDSGCAAGYYEPWHIEMKGVGNCQGNDNFKSGGQQIAAPLGIGNKVRAALGQPQALPAPQLAAIPTAPAQAQEMMSSFNTTEIPKTTAANASPTNGAARTPAEIAAELERIAALPPTASPVPSTAAPIPISGISVANITSSAQAHAQPQPVVSGVISVSDQTFASNELNSQTDTYNDANQLPPLLRTIQETLTRMRPYLTPFGTYQRPEE